MWIQPLQAQGGLLGRLPSRLDARAWHEATLGPRAAHPRDHAQARPDAGHPTSVERAHPERGLRRPPHEAAGRSGRQRPRVEGVRGFQRSQPPTSLAPPERQRQRGGAQCRGHPNTFGAKHMSKVRRRVTFYAPERARVYHESIYICIFIRYYHIISHTQNVRCLTRIVSAGYTPG